MSPNPASVFGKRRMAPGAEALAMPAVISEVLPVETSNDEATMATRALDHTLGNPELPIVSYREQIVSAVDDSQATVITAETGAGKSTQVPQFLAEAGYEVIVTQPRVVAARSVAERVRDEIVAEKGPEYATFVGHRTARERSDSPDNQILFVTDGLQLVRELSGNGAGKKQALVLDEVHEWNENMEVLVAWAKQRMGEDPDFKVVTMSATMEADKLSRYFADDGKHEVPVIEVPGRTFEVKKEEGGDVADEAIKFARDGKNTLVFVPGKAEITEVIAQIERANIPGATILPLHGQLDKEEQRKVFKRYPGAKVIVATNVAQTSITIEDIDAVVDSGLERQNQVKNGVEGLYLNPISQADCLQRAGRAGRTKAGEYVLAQLSNNKLVPMSERPAYGTPEILRTRLDGMVLRLAKGGLDAAELEFYHQPEHADIAKAKTRLQKLGALREDGSITKVGRDMDRMPVESHYARMMIEARQYGPEVQTQLAAMLAVQEAGGICQFETKSKPCDERWRNLLAPDMNDSDAIKQLEVFVAAERMSDSQKRNHDIYVRAFSKSREVLRQLRSVEKLQDQNLSAPTKEQREQLVKCIIAGMVDNLYVRGAYGDYTDAAGRARETSGRSCIRPDKMIVGNPFDLQVNTLRGLKTLHLIEGATNVPSVDVLREVAPQLFTHKNPQLRITGEGRVVEQSEVHFNGQNTGDYYTRPAKKTSETIKLLVESAVSAAWWNSVNPILNQAQVLQKRTLEKLDIPTRQMVTDAALEAASVLEIDTLDEAKQCVPEMTLEDIVPADKRAEILANSPDEWKGLTLDYRNGMPCLMHRLDREEALALNAAEMTLPDGREILHYDGNTIAAAQESIRRTMEQEEQKYSETVQVALSYLRRGYTQAEMEYRYGARAGADANVLYEAELAEAAQQAEHAEKLRGEQTVQLEKMLDENEDMYNRTRLAGIDDDTTPDEIWNEVDAVRTRLDDMHQELERKRSWLQHGGDTSLEVLVAEADQLRTRVQSIAQRFMAWQQAEKEREKQPVSADALAALTAHFNKR